MCGLKSKLRFPEFCQLISLHDIFVCIESKLDDLDSLNMPDGYTYYSKNKKKLTRNQAALRLYTKLLWKNILSL